MTYLRSFKFNSINDMLSFNSNDIKVFTQKSVYKVELKNFGYKEGQIHFKMSTPNITEEQ